MKNTCIWKFKRYFKINFFLKTLNERFERNNNKRKEYSKKFYRFFWLPSTFFLKKKQVQNRKLGRHFEKVRLGVKNFLTKFGTKNMQSKTYPKNGNWTRFFQFKDWKTKKRYVKRNPLNCRNIQRRQKKKQQSSHPLWIVERTITVKKVKKTSVSGMVLIDTESVCNLKELTWRNHQKRLPDTKKRS